MNFVRERRISQAASDLVQFDQDSIRQVAAGRRLASPDVWVADPDAYEKDGRVLRDSESPRMLAYSTKDRILYATDGCNSCARPIALPAADLEKLTGEDGIPKELLRALSALLL